ncbi:MAG TPA: copper resistance protein CopC [Gaiellaceae bacterium]|jgi:copper transport protein|nr:copper resistance protein CopC [Gaiellaceae bacterium]
MRRAGFAAALAALAFPASAFAHASLEHTWPSFRERVETSPTSVRLNFDQAVTVLPGSVSVYSAGGTVVSAQARSGADKHFVVTPVRKLGQGPYTVRWHVLSGDGHVVSGVFTFGVRYPAPPPTEAYGASGPTTTEHVVRWAYFLALALLVGGLGFRLLVVRGSLPRRAERRFYVVTGIGAVAVLEVGIVAFLLRAEDALQLPLGRLLYGDLSPIVGGTRFGQAFIAMTLGFALVAALLYLAWLTDRTIFLWPAFLLGLGFASGLSLSGHSAADAGSSWLSELADWIHLSAATLWMGGLVQLVAVVWPGAPELRRIAFLRFSRLAGFLVACLVGAGIYLSILRLPHLADLWTQGYGHVLLVKLALVCVALSWGAVHHFVARPALERGEGGILTRLPRSLAGESTVAMAVLLAAAVLVDSKPPPRPAKPQTAQPVVRAR